MFNKYIPGDVLEVGAGCGGFTRDYIDNNLKITLTETDKKNYDGLKKIFENNKNVEVEDKKIFQIEKKFDTILYLHVLEHIEDDKNELNEVFKKLKSNGVLIIMVPQHQSLYSNLTSMSVILEDMR